MQLFTRWWRRQHPRTPRANRVQLRLEALEDRITPNNRFVIPVAVIPDNVSTFATLKAALTTPGLAAGEVVQIQLGSSPGNIVDADLPAVANLLIQGDPAAGRSEIPAINIDDAVIINAARAGFSLRNVQVNLQGGGLTFTADGSIYRSHITNNFAGTAITFNAIVNGVLQDSFIVANDGTAGGDVVLVNVIAGSQNLIAGNTIVSRAAVDHHLLRYFGPNAITDKVVNNTFLGNEGFASRPLFLTDALGTNGLTVQGNTFRDTDSNQKAIGVGVGTTNLVLNDNTISLTGAVNTCGIIVVGGGVTPTSLLIGNNRIDTAGNGTGIQFVWTVAGGSFAARVEGNDFHSNKIGVHVLGNLAGSVINIDLGGGGQGSLGANNFRGFTALASATQGAIVTTALLADGPISAKRNLFGVANPEDVVFDQADVAANADIEATDNLTGNIAFVAALYLDLLGRRPQFDVPSDAIIWVNTLGIGVSALTVANGIARSPEALSRRVDLLYRQLLQRNSDAPGKAQIVTLLQGGGPIEPAIRGQLGSNEYRLLFGSDGAFVESLYTGLLHRNPTNAEVTAQVAVIADSSRFALADQFLKLPEYRAFEVRRFYAQKLNRLIVTDAEINGWANSALGLLAIEIQIAASPEFQANG